MERTCGKYQNSFGREPDNVLICPRCGDEWSAPFAARVDVATSFPNEQGSGGDSARSAAQATTLQLDNSERGVSNSLSLNQPKSPVLAALLSSLLVGMGQIYLGQVEKGLCMLVVVLLLVMSSAPGPWDIVLLLISVLDAFLLGRKVKRGHQLRRWQFFFSRNDRWEFGQFIGLSPEPTASQESGIALVSCERRPRNN